MRGIMGDNNVCLALCDLDQNNENQDMYSVSFSAESDTRYHLDFFSLINNGVYINLIAMLICRKCWRFLQRQTIKE